MDNNVIWKNVLETLRDKTNEQNFNLWFNPLQVDDVTDDSWILRVPNRFMKDWITDHYQDILEHAFYEVLHHQPKIFLVVDPNPSSETVSGASKSTKAKRPRKRKTPQTLGLPLNFKFVFDSFVVGPSNEFAQAACRAVADHPGSSYNPLFLYGGTGLGKTHLLQAIGHMTLSKNSKARVIYITSERFVSDMVNSIATNQMSNFKRRYRDQCDVLLMDDIQFIAGKSSTQDEFFHTFNFLFESGKQIVVTSDKYPQEIKALDERIRSRLSSGLVADIQAPDIETRMAILQRKARSDGFELDEEVLRFLAKYIKSNVRELEGSLIRLEAYSSLTGGSISLASARNLLKEVVDQRPANLSSKKIQKRVCNYFDIKLSDMHSKSRARKLVVPRQIAMYLVKRYTDLSLSDIGSKFGGKDHTTVISSLKRIERLMSEDMNIRNSIEALEKQLELS